MLHRRPRARHAGAALGRTSGADRRGTQALKYEGARRPSGRSSGSSAVEKPWQPWELQLRSAAASAPATSSSRLERRGVERGAFRARPARPRAAPGRAGRARRAERQRQDDAARRAARRGCRSRRARARVGPGVGARRARPGAGALRRRRAAARRLRRASRAARARRRGRCWPSSASAPTHVLRPARSLSPGERTRARLARCWRARRQLPRARRADEPPRPAGDRAARGARSTRYDGTLLLVTHDRRFLERSRRPGSWRFDHRLVRLESAAADGRPEEKNLQVAPRQAPRPARHRGAARERLPDLRPAEAAAPRVPDLQDVQGPRGRAAPHARSVARMTVRVAVDAMGGDRGPDEIVAGALEAPPTGSSRPLRPGRRSTPAGSSSSTPTQVIAMDEKPAEAVRGEAGQLARRRLPCRRRGRGRRGRLGREHRRDAGRRPARDPAAPGRDAPGDRRRRSRRGDGPSVLLDCGANADARAGAPAPVRPHGRDLRRGDPRHRRARGAACSRSARSRRRATSSRSRRTSCSPRATSNFAGNAESRELLARRRRRRRHRRLHRQRRAEAARGDDPDRARRRSATRSRATRARQARRPADPAGRAAPAAPARPRHLRRRLPARPARARRDRARQLVADARSRTRSGSPRAASSTTSSDGSRADCLRANRA